MNIISAVSLVVLCFYTSASNAQDYQPWTGTVVGATINLGNDQSLKTIRRLINEGNTVDAVRESKKLVAVLTQRSRSGEETGYKYDAYNALCISLTANKEYDEAMTACNDAIEGSPSRWQAINSRGSLKYKTGKFAEALEDYRNALANAPETKHITRIIEHNIEISEARVTNR